MKFNFVGLSSAMKAIQVTAPKGNTVIEVGGGQVEGKLVCRFRASESTRQLLLTTYVDKPKDFEKPFKLFLNTQQLVGAVLALTGEEDKSEVFLSVTGDNVVHVGKSGKAGKSKVRLDVAAEEPVQIVPGNAITLFMGDESFNHFLAAGCNSAKVGDPTMMGAAGIVLNTVTGEIRGYSTDCQTLARAKKSVKVARLEDGQAENEKKVVESMQEALKAYCEKNDTQMPEALNVKLWAADVQLVLKLAREVKGIYQVAVDDANHVLFMFPSFVLTVTQPEEAITAGMVDGVFNEEAPFAFSVDSEVLKNEINLCNNVMLLKKNGKLTVPMRVEVREKDVKLYYGQGKALDVETVVPGVTVSGAPETFAIDGLKFAHAIRMIGRGNILCSYMSRGVVLCGGSIAEGGDKTAEIYVCRVNEAAGTDDVEAEEARSTEAELVA